MATKKKPAAKKPAAKKKVAAKKPAAKKVAASNADKATLGDLDALANLKEQMDNE